NGKFGQLSVLALGVDPVMPQLRDQLERVGKGVDRPNPEGNPFRVRAVRAFVLLIYRRQLPGESRRKLPIEVLHHPPALVAAVEAGVTGVAKPGSRSLSVLNGKGVLASQKACLLVLQRDRPATVFIIAAGLVDIADAELQLAAGVGIEAADVEIVATDVFVLEVAVLARKGVAVRQPVDLHVLDPEAGGALIPVIE